MPSFPVSQSKIAELIRLMEKYGVQEQDLEEKFVRGSGAGGQKINKTSSSVWLLHRPTGMHVKCQSSRSQALNRFLARRLLVQEIANQIERAKSAEQQRIEKIRRQKRKRSRRAKEKMLAEKNQNKSKRQERQIPWKEY